MQKVGSGARTDTSDGNGRTASGYETGVLWVILPARNAAATLAVAITDARMALGEAAATCHFLVVDDVSSDDTASVAAELAADDPYVHLLRHGSRLGLGGACVTGLLHAADAGADVVLSCGDASSDAGALGRLLDEIIAGAQLVVGSPSARNAAGGVIALRGNVLDRLELPAGRHGWASVQREVVDQAERAGLRVREVTVRGGGEPMSTPDGERAGGWLSRMVARLCNRRVRRAPDGAQHLRVLMVTRGVVPLAPGAGGAELAAFELSRALASAGHQVTLLTDFADGQDAGPGVTLAPIDFRLIGWSRRVPGSFANWLARHLAGNLGAMLRARRILREQPCDIVHAHGALSAVLLAFSAAVPVVYTEHDAPPWLCRHRSRLERVVRRAVYRTINVAAFRCADHVGATFAAMREDAIRRFGIAQSKVTTIVNGTNISVFTAPEPTPAEHALDASLRNGGRPVTFDRFCLFVGRLESRKAPDLLVRALVQVPAAECVFVGDGPMRADLEQLAGQLGVSDRVAFLGYVRSSDLPALYARAKLLVLPSVSEAMPLVVLEAMACGTPVLASRIAGLPSVVRDYETGVLVEPGDVGQLALAMRFLLRDEALLRHMSDRARRLVQASFVWSTVAEAYARVYRSFAAPRVALNATPLTDPIRPQQIHYRPAPVMEAAHDQ